MTKFYGAWIPALAGMTALLLFVPPNLKAADDAGRADTFLNYAASARSVGMGQAHVGVADDSSATYWNPAGLTQLNRMDIVTMYSSLQEDSGYGFASFGSPFRKKSALGVGIASLRSGDFKRRNILGEQTGSFDTTNTAMLLSYAGLVNSNWSLGTTVKVISQSIDSSDATGYGADFGVLGRLNARWKAGLAVRNLLAPSLKHRSESDEFPRDVRLGAQYAASPRFLLASDIGKAQNESVKVNLGADWIINEVLSIRTGLNETELAAGLGFQLGDFGLDYAFGYNVFSSNIQDLGGTHKVGFHVGFGQLKTTQKEIVTGPKKDKNYYLAALSSYVSNPASKRTKDVRLLVHDTKKLIDKGLIKEPKDLYRAQGYISYFKGDYSRSALLLAKAAELDPQNTVLTQQLAQVRSEAAQSGKNEVVKEHLRKARQLYAEGDFDGARDYAEKALAASPKNPEANAMIKQVRDDMIDVEMKFAQQKFDRGEYIGSFIHLRKVLEMDPNHPEATKYTIQTLTLMEKESSATTANTKSVDEITQNVEKSMTLYNEGQALYKKGQLKQAVKSWEDALRFAKGNYLAREALNKALDEIQDQSFKKGSF